MKILGKNLNQLEEFGTTEFTNNFFDISDKITEDLKQKGENSIKFLTATRTIASEEAIIKTAAAMIEYNNQFLTKQLKDEGLLKD